MDKKSDDDQTKYDKWNKALSIIQPSSGDYIARNLIRIYLSFYSEEEREKICSEIDKEIEEESVRKTK